MRKNRVRDKEAVREIMRMEPPAAEKAAAAAALAAAAASAPARRRRNTDAAETAAAEAETVRCVYGMQNMFVDPANQNEPQMKVYRRESSAAPVCCVNLARIEEQLDEIAALIRNSG